MVMHKALRGIIVWIVLMHNVIVGLDYDLP